MLSHFAIHELTLLCSPLRTHTHTQRETQSCRNLSGDDPINNFMNYSDDDCMSEFTSGQFDRMLVGYTKFRAPSDGIDFLEDRVPTAAEAEAEAEAAEAAAAEAAAAEAAAAEAAAAEAAAAEAAAAEAAAAEAAAAKAAAAKAAAAKAEAAEAEAAKAEAAEAEAAEAEAAEAEAAEAEAAEAEAAEAEAAKAESQAESLAGPSFPSFASFFGSSDTAPIGVLTPTIDSSNGFFGFPDSSSNGGFPGSSSNGGFPGSSSNGGFPGSSSNGGFPGSSSNGGFPDNGFSGFSSPGIGFNFFTGLATEPTEPITLFGLAAFDKNNSDQENSSELKLSSCGSGSSDCKNDNECCSLKCKNKKCA
jgi:hypothetical protein